MYRTVETLKERAQELISEALNEAATRQDRTDNQAEKLLAELEPIIWKYAPIPDGIVEILKEKAMLMSIASVTTTGMTKNRCFSQC